MSKKISLPVPTESEEQQALFRWAEVNQSRYPQLALLYHVPNGGKRTKATAARLKAEGVKSGVPDICLPCANSRHHGLYIELKRVWRGCISPEQHRWIDALNAAGYRAVVCKGWAEAAAEIMSYLEG